MWSKEEAKERRKRFFTNFGVYMKKYAHEYEEKIRWVNYRTGVPSIAFRIEADNKKASVSIDIINKDATIREIFFEQFREFKALLESEMDELIWTETAYNKVGQPLTKIYTETFEYSINNEAHWGSIYKFFEKNIVALHEFWENTKEIFIDLDS